MITTETQVRDFETARPLPSFRLRAPNTNPFVPSFPASVTGIGPGVQFAWGTTPPNAASPDQSGSLVGIVEKLRHDVERFPKSAMVRVNLAGALVNQGNLDEAENELSGALELEPRNYLARIVRAHLLARKARFDEATKVYEEMLAERPSDNTILLSLAVMALRSNNLPEAEEKLRLVTVTRRNDATIHFLLGVVRLGMGNLGGAVAELRTASRIDVRNPAIHQALGVIFAVRSEFDRAEQEFRAALMLAPHDKGSMRSLYQVLLKQEKTSEAVDILKFFIERNPADLAAREALALGLVNLKQFSSARFHMSRLLGESADAGKDQVARIQANVGLAWFLEGKIESARTALVKAIETYPSVSPIAYENLARLYLGEDDAEAARDVLVRSKTIFPQSAVTAVLLGLAYAMNDEVAQAIKEVEVFRSRHDATMEVYVQLGFLYALINRPGESLEASKSGLQNFPHSPMLLNNLAYVYAMTDQLEEARGALKMIPKDTAPHIGLVATRGLIRLREGDEKQGVELYEDAERLAVELGNKDLARRVRQKKHLEVARFLIRKNVLDRARNEIKQGLAVRVKYFPYRQDLMGLAKELGMPSTL